MTAFVQRVLVLTQSSMSPAATPSGSGLTLVLQAGKWRRQIPLPNIKACSQTILPDPPSPADKLRLPAKSSEGDMPLIAFTSGCDPAECFLRHVGIDDSEFVPPGSTTGHVHFYTGKDITNGKDASQVAGGNTSTDTYQWWTLASNLQKYDIIFNACECGANDRGPGAYAAMESYLSGGGRLFATHYYYNWFAPPTGPTEEQDIATWDIGAGTPPNGSSYFIDQTRPKGALFAAWLQAQGVTSTPGQIALTDTRHDMDAINPVRSTRWIYNAFATTPLTDTDYATMYMSFNMPPPLLPPATGPQQCGRAVFQHDIHLSGASDDTMFPMECANPDPVQYEREGARVPLLRHRVLRARRHGAHDDPVVGPGVPFHRGSMASAAERHAVQPRVARGPVGCDAFLGGTATFASSTSSSEEAVSPRLNQTSSSAAPAFSMRATVAAGRRPSRWRSRSSAAPHACPPALPSRLSISAVVISTRSPQFSPPKLSVTSWRISSAVSRPRFLAGEQLAQGGRDSARLVSRI